VLWRDDTFAKVVNYNNLEVIEYSKCTPGLGLGEARLNAEAGSSSCLTWNNEEEGLGNLGTPHKELREQSLEIL
jgi:hypothetical protein